MSLVYVQDGPVQGIYSMILRLLTAHRHLSQDIILQTVQLSPQQQLLLLYQLGQQLHGLVDLLQWSLAEGCSDVVTGLRRVCHESVAWHEGYVLLQASGHQHLIDVGHASYFDPHEHSSSWDGPVAETLEVSLHGGQSEVPPGFIVGPDSLELGEEAFEAPHVENVLQ